ncbi:hypothetical protein [Entomobacter blattae]|uniref:Uncharacterized protein n=1 Tax=Entomobacter blattae TaxID=2762277 RepID=A0A7H1NP88_9PROT|nr:hypothetical protein [Entomobacter blattae]QNT77598.1 hypothetical protein JGUZn3_03410 [Entomobacter blattae]
MVSLIWEDREVNITIIANLARITNKAIFRDIFGRNPKDDEMDKLV